MAGVATGLCGAEDVTTVLTGSFAVVRAMGWMTGVDEDSEIERPLREGDCTGVPSGVGTTERSGESSGCASWSLVYAVAVASGEIERPLCEGDCAGVPSGVGTTERGGEGSGCMSWSFVFAVALASAAAVTFDGVETVLLEGAEVLLSGGVLLEDEGRVAALLETSEKRTS